MAPTQFVFDAIGTRWIIDITASLSSIEKTKMLHMIKKCIDDYDQIYSRFRTDSLVTKISQKKGTYLFPQESDELFSLYKKMYDVTNHKVTPLIGQTLSDAGYDASYSLTPKTLQKPPPWEEAIRFQYPRLSAKKPVLLDFGACGKGQLVDIIAALLEQNNIADFCIDAGGDIGQHTSKNAALKVGLEHPEDPYQVIGVVSLKNQSICGSSGNRRTWGAYHHIIDPYTLSSPKNIISTWAVAKSTLLADGMTTCLFFMSGKQLKKHFDFEYFVLYDNYTYELSPGFTAEIYTNVGTISR
jgi:FAD:protein FMN transferase